MLGGIPFFVGTEDPLVHMVLLTFLSFYIVGGVTVYSPYWGFLMLYNIPLVSFSATHAIIDGQGPLVFIGYTYFIWIPVTFVMVRAFNKFINNGILLAHRNNALVKKLDLEKREAEQANLGKSRFIAAASHDLRQPLHALGLFAAQLDKTSNDRDRHILHHEIVSSVKALRTMFDGLLDISRIDADTITPNIETFKLNSLFQKIQSEFASAAEVKEIGFKVIPSSVCIKTDKNLFERILRNLVSNAIRYTDSGRVIVGVRRLNGLAKIQVCDTGLGIDDSQQENIFEEFYQVSNPERDREKGVGLGLAIVKRLVTILNHSLSVRSLPGKGSSFSIVVPYGDEKDACSGSEFVAKEVKLNGMAVLIVDDDAPILAAMRLTLESWGCLVFSAESGEEAEQLLDNEGILPDVLIVDYRLREHEKGSHVIKRLQDYLGEQIDTIMLTGDLEVDISKEIDVSHVTQLHKPIEPLTLNKLLADIKQKKVD
jgi:signal transduction histidine kinase/CheY-like chemotaxis protein